MSLPSSLDILLSDILYHFLFSFLLAYLIFHYYASRSGHYSCTMGFFSKGTSQNQSGAYQVQVVAPNSQQGQTSSQSSATGYRPIFLLVWPSALFKAHWAIFIPEASDKTFKTGKYIHAEGNPKDGFNFQVVRGWDMNQSRRRPQVPIEIGWVPANLVSDIATEGGRLVKESVARDQLEAYMAAIPTPDATMIHVAAGQSSSGKKKELSNCQWWVIQVVKSLAECGVLIAAQKGLNKNKDPRQIVADAPLH